jgi:hypothetical protein
MDTPSKRPSLSRKPAFGALGLLTGLLAFYAAVTIWTLGDASLQDPVGRWVYDAVVLGAALLVLARAASVPAERGAWLALGGGLLLWALGQTYYSVVLYYASPAPFPSPADFGFLAFYPLSYLALVLLLRARVAHLERLAWVDGLIGALAVAGVAAALIFPPVLEALEGSAFGVAVSLAYPCFDLVLLGLLSGAFAASKWRTEGTWLLIAGALLLFSACDVVYLSVGGQSTAALNIASVGWPLAFLLLAAASWLPATATGVAVARAERRRIAVPIAMGMVGVTLPGRGADAAADHLRAEHPDAAGDRDPRRHRRAHRPRQPASADGRPRGRGLGLAPGGDGPGAVRPRRLQVLQRQLRPPGRRRSVAAPRQPAAGLG